ncbi:MAG: Sulfurtransferase [Gemmatimonadetes bacterium]|nr:Sulfurtransferase [Gemmatimonadota bacterium]
MTFTTLISTGELGELLDEPPFAVAVVDCRFILDDVDWGRREYVRAHIRGAVYADLDHDLSSAKTGTNGRHPLPSPDALRATFSKLGIADGVQVIAYDQDNGMYASRLWWLLRWMGHDAVAVLDGGFAKWDGPTASGKEHRAPREFVGTPRDELLVLADSVANSDWRLIDARAPERYRGDVEPLDKVAGHIPGAVNHFYKHNLDEAGLFLPPGELRARLSPVVGGVAPDHIVSYCGSGVTGCHNVLALEHAGMHGARLYAGSWSEWASDPARAIAKG